MGTEESNSGELSRRCDLAEDAETVTDVAAGLTGEIAVTAATEGLGGTPIASSDDSGGTAGDFRL